MIHHDPRTLRPGSVHADALADRIVITVYRCTLAGFSIGDVQCWDLAWQALERELPLEHARALHGEFHHFFRTLVGAAPRPVAFRPATCRGLCGDEATVLRILETAQKGRPDRLVEAMGDLAASRRAADIVEAACALATALLRHGLVLTAPPERDCGEAACPARSIH